MGKEIAINPTRTCFSSPTPTSTHGDPEWVLRAAPGGGVRLMAPFFAGAGEGRRPASGVHAAAGGAAGLPAVCHGHRRRPGEPEAKLGLHRQLVQQIPCLA